jgi:hypothetical protein
MRISNTALSVFASLFLLTGISAPQSASAQSTQAPTIETQLQTSYTEYDFKLYKGIKGITDDKEVEGRKQFESERNALMKARPDLFKGVVTPVEPSAEAPTAEPGIRTKPNKPTYNSNRGTRKVEMKKSTNGKNRGKYIINIYFN